MPLLGDDLASQFGTSAVRRAVLRLLQERGLVYAVEPGEITIISCRYHYE